ncbi:MAG: hypothetical protein P4M14_07280 [Gammaproteobacteria bacterium]|nr:hypothetical protein [Gammaproteobacteria bacterium]
MPKIEIAELITSGVYPDLASIKKSLGKRDFALYEMYEGHNDLDQAEFLLKLGKRFERNTRGVFGTEKIYKAGLCYALSALLHNINGYKYLISAIKKEIFFYDFFDSRLTDLLVLCETKKRALQAIKPVEPLAISDAVLVELLSKVSEQVEMTLGHRLDVAYDIYLRSSALLSADESSAEQKNIMIARKSAIKLMSAILDTDDEKRILRLMNLRIAKRKLDPEYIPGKSPRKMVNLPDPLRANKKAKYHWRHLARLALASVRGKILTVSQRAKEKDVNENTRFLSPTERDAHRVIIRNGKFYERELNNEFKLCDTRDRVSHEKTDYVAFTINLKGEISLFDHFEIADRFAHSSMNAQAPLFFAGEIQILNGEFKALTLYSMHYGPSLSNVYEVLEYFHVHGVDLSNALVQTWGESNQYQGNNFSNYNALDFYENFTVKGLSHLQLVSTGRISAPEENDAVFNTSTKKMRESLSVTTPVFEDFEPDFNFTPPSVISSQSSSAAVSEVKQEKREQSTEENEASIAAKKHLPRQK